MRNHSKINSNYHTEAALNAIFSTFPQSSTRNRDYAYAFLTRALTYRSTSRLEDEPICLASILGFNSREIALIADANTAEEKTHLMYTLMDQMPACILFNRSRKISKGFRWAPASLMGGAQHTFLRGKGKAT